MAQPLCTGTMKRVYQRTCREVALPPPCGPIAPPFRAGASGAGITVAAPTTRTTRSMTASSLTSSGESGGAPYGHGQQQQRAAFDPANPFGPLTDLPQAARASMSRQDESSSGDNTASAEGKQRGAPLRRTWLILSFPPYRFCLCGGDKNHCNQRDCSRYI